MAPTGTRDPLTITPSYPRDRVPEPAANAALGDGLMHVGLRAGQRACLIHAVVMSSSALPVLADEVAAIDEVRERDDAEASSKAPFSSSSRECF